MSLSEMLLPEFDQEMANARKALERVPEGRSDWKPHEKSMTLGRLASHIAEIPTWGEMAFTADFVDVEPPGEPPRKGLSLASTREILDLFDANVERARKALAAATDEAFGETWTLKRAGDTIFALPRLAVLRSMVLNHLIHHRGQLTVYLRLNDVPLPALYGPSADESF